MAAYEYVVPEGSFTTLVGGVKMKLRRGSVIDIDPAEAEAWGERLRPLSHVPKPTAPTQTILDLHWSKVVAAVKQMTDASELKRLLAEEKGLTARSSVLSAINKRLAEV